MSHSLSKRFTFSSLLLFALPTMVMMVIMSLYTIVDGFFVSKFVGTNALSSTNIVFPIINVIIGIAIMFATGGNAMIAKKMGERNQKEANHIFSLIVITSVIVSIVIAVVGNIFIEPIVSWAGASELLKQDCITYLSTLLYFCPALVLQILFQTFFVTEGKPIIGLVLTILAGVVNVLFDYIFIVPMDLGVRGAALATAMGYLIPAIFGLFYFFHSKVNLSFVCPYFSLSILKESCLNGSSEMVINLSSGIITFLFNILMLKYRGEDGVAAITIIQYSQFLLNAMYMGFAQGIAPIISYNYGSKNTTQLKQIFKHAIWFTSISSVIVFIFAESMKHFIIQIFAKSGSAVFQLALEGFVIFSFSFLFFGVNVFASALFTALSDGKVSALLSFVRTFGFIVISLLILPIFLDVTGIWLAVPIAELGGLLFSSFYIKKLKTKYHYL